jgi:hypothetical protein
LRSGRHEESCIEPWRWNNDSDCAYLGHLVHDDYSYASGEELTRKAGENSIVQLPIGRHGNWWNSMYLDLDQEINPYIDVLVADTISERRSQFRITRER